MAEPPPSSPQQLGSHERRRHPRFRPLAHVHFSGAGEVAVLPIADISAGGIRLTMHPDELIKLDIDEHVSVFLEAASDGQDGPVFVEVDATVVRIKRSEPAHIALEWHERPPDIAERFDAVLRILQQTTQ